MQSRVLAIFVAVVLALVATAALVVYVNSADRRAMRDLEPVRVWVAIKPIPAGTSGLNASNTGLIAQVEMPKKNAVKGVVISLPQIQNKFGGGRHRGGRAAPAEPLGRLRRGLRSAPATGSREAPGALHRGGADQEVAGFVTPGDPVSLVVSLARKNAAGKDVDTSEFLLKNVQVLAVGTTALTTAGSQGGGGRVNQSKCLLDIFRKLEPLQKDAKSQVTVTWLYEEDDEDMMEAGEDYQTIVKLPFEIKKFS